MATSNKRPAVAIDFENRCTMAYHTHSQLQEVSKCTSASIPFFDRSNEEDQVCSKLCTTIHPLAALSSLSSAGEERVSSRKFWGGKLKANLAPNCLEKCFGQPPPDALVKIKITPESTINVARPLRAH